MFPLKPPSGKLRNKKREREPDKEGMEALEKVNEECNQARKEHSIGLEKAHKQK